MKWLGPIALFVCIVLLGTAISARQEKQMNNQVQSVAQARAIPAIDATQPDDYSTATFAAGWFWGVEARFGSIPGVIRTRVGYTGGSTPAPTYESIGNHTEAVQVDFDPQRISYDQLLDAFFAFHNVCTPNWSTQYKGAVFAHSEEQQRRATAKLAQQSAKKGSPAETEVQIAGTFYLAEDYHQKYALRQYKKMSQALLEVYPRLRDFIDSTAAARLNAFAHGYGTPELLEAEIDSYGLPPDAEQELRDLVE